MKITSFQPQTKIKICPLQLARELGSPVTELEEVAPNVWVATMFLAAAVAGHDCLIRGSGATTRDALQHMYAAAAHHVFPQYDVLPIPSGFLCATTP